MTDAITTRLDSAKRVHQEITFNATPAQVYAALMETERHASLTGAEADISDEVGGSFSCHGGVISGRNIELVKGERIVQAWRVANWAPGVFSMIRYELAEAGQGKTKLTFVHDAIPAGQAEHLADGWSQRYWTPMKAYFAR